MRKFAKTAILCFSEAYPELWDGSEMPGMVVDCRDIEGTCGYLSKEAAALVTSRLEAAGDVRVRLIDSGDYHHVSYLTASRTGLPYSLVLLDNHPDMQRAAFGDVLSCGGWLRSLLEDDPFAKEAVVIGIDPALREECQGFGGRVRVCVRGEEPGPLKLSYPAFISIDKDVLSTDYASTDWDQGTMTMDALEDIVREVFRTVPVLGVDICGEITSSKGGTPADRKLNLAANLRLLKEIESLFEENVDDE